MTEQERLEATVHGIVQGVFFRYSTQIEAERLGLTGAVRNLDDGSVHVVAEGRRDRLERLLGWLGRGPELAVVERVDATWSESAGSFTSFRIVR